MITRFVCRRVLRAACVAGALGIGFPAMAQPAAAPGAQPAQQPAAPPPAQPAPPPAQAAPPPAPNGAPALTQQDVGAFLDGLIPQNLARDDIAGAVASVVADGKVLFAKGYGLADVASGTPVSVDDTLFRIGSISKLFTWTLVMQLVEARKLDLDTDVNAYLDFHIAGLGGAPITLRNLMTHSAGFSDIGRDLIFTGTAVGPNALGEFVKTHVPPCRTKPGEVAAYSNYGAALAGYIVERASGKPFADVLSEKILSPLGMTHTSIAQPLPAGLTLSSGYDVSTGKAKKFEDIPSSPAGAISATGADMARFMLAWLHPGTLLQPATQATMWAHQFGIDPRIAGIALGFAEDGRNGVRSVGHGGDTQYFHSDLHILPAQGVGIFLSINSTGKAGASGKLRNLVWRSFMDRYYPAPKLQLHAVADARKDADALAGSWIGSRRLEVGFSRLNNVAEIASGAAVVSAHGDGTISFSALKAPDGEARRWTETEHDLWRDPSGLRLAVKRDAAGTPILLGAEPYAFANVYERPPLDEGRLPATLFALAFLVPLLFLLMLPFRALARRVYEGESATTRKLRLVLKLLILATPFALVAVIALFGALASSDLSLLSTEGSRPWLLAMRIAGYAVIAAAALASVDAVAWWLDVDDDVRWRRFEATTLALAMVIIAAGVATYGVLDQSGVF